MKNYLKKDTIDLRDSSFEQKQIKDTTKKIGKNTYRETVEAWVKKNNACRLNAGQKEVEEAFRNVFKIFEGLHGLGYGRRYHKRLGRLSVKTLGSLQGFDEAG